MLRRMLLLGLMVSLVVVGQASAQVIVPGLPLTPKVKLPPFPNIEAMPFDLQQILQQAAQLQPKGGKADGSILWGGVRLQRATGEMQAQLGLAKDEGLVVAAVDPNSAEDRAGLKTNDVLLKINAQSVPNDIEGFNKLVKEQKVADSADIVVIRDGKEETLKGAKMPAVAQMNPIGGRGGVNRIAIGGIFGQRIQIIQRGNPLQPGAINKLHIERTVNGAKVVQRQNGDQFSADYVKEELTINVAGKIENGVRTAKEITITQGKDTQKFANLKDVPSQYQLLIRQLMQPPVGGQLMLPTIPNLQNFPGLPAIPGIDD